MLAGGQYLDASVPSDGAAPVNLGDENTGIVDLGLVAARLAHPPRNFNAKLLVVPAANGELVQSRGGWLVPHGEHHLRGRFGERPDHLGVRPACDRFPIDLQDSVSDSQAIRSLGHSVRQDSGDEDAARFIGCPERNATRILATGNAQPQALANAFVYYDILEKENTKPLA